MRKFLGGISWSRLRPTHSPPANPPRIAGPPPGGFTASAAACGSSSGVSPIWWAVATVTTVGYGDIIPVTDMGKVVGIGTMILGTALFWSFTALFAEALISDEITDVESELRSISRALQRLASQDLAKEGETQKLIVDLEARIATLRGPQSQVARDIE